MSSLSTRNQIINAADRMFYQHGYQHTSFSDIADEVQISRGNFYYHFKTKDEILDAVIEQRLENTRKMLEKWELDSTRPDHRILSFIQILLVNKIKIKQYGCPIGSLTTELSKLNHVSIAGANKLFGLFRYWLRRQFKLLGCKSNADKYAMHILARSQGVATLANAFHDDKFIKYEVTQMCDWLNSLIKSVSADKN